jgi:indole-3-glycerol phosphate synthase
VSRDFLSAILSRKRESLMKQRASIDVAVLRGSALERREKGVAHRLRRALQAASPQIKIIAEFKRKSPSIGTIRNDLDAADVARGYERGGACAISVLTDDEDFGGSIVDLTEVRGATQLPILRKDFIIHPIQLYEAAAAGADAVLLIAAALDGRSLSELRKTAEAELGLDALVEVHTSAELHRAIDAGATIVGVNNRDLHTFEVSLEMSERLIAEAPSDKLMLSESGLRDAASLRRLQALGYRGFLIGEALMRAADPETALRQLITEAQDRQHIRIGAPQL